MSVYVRAELRRRVRNHFANCCDYCRTAEDLAVAIFEFEHIVPRSASDKRGFGSSTASKELQNTV